MTGGSKIHADVRFPGTQAFRCIDFRAAPNDVFAALTDAPSNKAASRLVDRNRKLIKNFAACYVFECESIGRTKIGFSTNPDLRLRGISTLLPDRAKIVALFWSFPERARMIEGKSLIAAKRRGVKANGEWVTISGHETVRLIMETVRYEVPYVDSSGFLDHWVSRDDMPNEYLKNEGIQVAERSGIAPLRGFLRI